MKSLEECRQLKKYDRSQYWDLVKDGAGASPWDFGCPDWHHDETGAVNYWIPPSKSILLKKEDPEKVPFEKQCYQPEKEEVIYENYRIGWSRMLDQGLINDYWRNYWDWN